jgi:uncharacterized delta-60 repeat protein
VEVDASGRYLLGTGGSIIGFDETGETDISFGASGTALGGPFFEIDALGRIVSGRVDGTIVRVDENGNLDTSFGDNGHVFTGGMDGLTIQPDGSIIVVSSTSDTRGLRIRRYDPDGDLDSGFGVNGEANLYPAGMHTQINVRGSDAIVMPDGDIVATGLIWGVAADFPAGLAVRVDEGGDPDPAFGGGDGMVRNFGVNDIEDVELLSGERLLLTGSSSGTFHTTVLLPNGEPDQDFGQDHGTAFVSWGTDPNPYCSATRAVDAETDSEGRIVLVGTVGQSYPCSGGSRFSFGLVRLLPDGTLDTSFGDGGRAPVDFSSVPTGDSPASPRGPSVGIDPLGRILLSARVGQQRMALARFLGEDTDGGADPGEGGEGDGGVKGVSAGRGVHVHRLLVPSSLHTLIRRGIRVLASCEQDCRIAVNVTVSEGVARRMGLGSLRFAHGSSNAQAGKRRWVIARLTRFAVRAMQTYDGGGRFKISVQGRTR